MRITCNTARDLLPLYYDQVLSKDSVDLVEEHLAGCPDCRSYLAAISAPDIKTAAGGFASAEAEPLKKIRRRMRRRQLIPILILCLVLTLWVCAAAGFFSVYSTWPDVLSTSDSQVAATGGGWSLHVPEDNHKAIYLTYSGGHMPATLAQINGTIYTADGNAHGISECIYMDRHFGFGQRRWYIDYDTDTRNLSKFSGELYWKSSKMSQAYTETVSSSDLTAAQKASAKKWLQSHPIEDKYWLLMDWKTGIAYRPEN
jgi:hypothetical protein